MARQRPKSNSGLARLSSRDGYLAGLGLDRGWCVIFDRRPDLPPVEKCVATMHATTPAGQQVTVIRA